MPSHETDVQCGCSKISIFSIGDVSELIEVLALLGTFALILAKRHFLAQIQRSKGFVFGICTRIQRFPNLISPKTTENTDAISEQIKSSQPSAERFFHYSSPKPYLI